MIINKFRGDASILDAGIEFIRNRTGVPVLGVLPWLPRLDLPAEDSLALGRSFGPTEGAREKHIRIGILKLPRISNFTDFDPFRHDDDVSVGYAERPEQMEGLDLLIIPGTKSTIPDLNYLREKGFQSAITAFNGRIVGICGGYQMLGLRVLDPERIESAVTEAAGLGLLPVETEMLPDKETHQALARLEPAGRSATGIPAGSSADTRSTWGGQPAWRRRAPLPASFSAEKTASMCWTGVFPRMAGLLAPTSTDCSTTPPSVLRT